MTTSELIEVLKDYPPDTVIVMSSDGEGNGYSPLAAYGDGAYEAETTWSGYFTSFDEDFEQSDMDDDQVLAVVLWPVN